MAGNDRDDHDDHDDKDHDEFRPMPLPPGGMHSPGAATRLEAAIATEAWQTQTLGRRLTPRRYCEATDLYPRKPTARYVKEGRARRIETRFRARGEEHLYDGGDIAHIVSLGGDAWKQPGCEAEAWCGARLLTGQRWSGLRAFATCPQCRLLAGPAKHGEQFGWLFRLGETKPLEVLKFFGIDPQPKETNNDHVEEQIEAPAVLIRGRHEGLARRAWLAARDALRRAVSLAA